MRLKRIIKDEKGATLPLVTIILGLFALGFIALVVDTGFLYVERKAMITSADAAALAGAQVLRDSEGVSVAEAKTAAENYAIANGADSSQVDVSVGNKLVTLPSGDTETRYVVEVTVGKNQQLIFARFLGDEDADVKAQAIATWGYVKKTYIGDFIPLFTFDCDYQCDTDILLHDKISDSNGYGFIDIGSGMGDIKEAIAGKSIGGTYIDSNLLPGKAGNGASLLLAVEARMELAQKQDTAEERRNTMIGLVPVIDKVEFDRINDGGSAAQWDLPIAYFAYFEILDVIKQNQSDGSKYALDPDNDYKGLNQLGKLPFNYQDLVGDKAEYVYVKGQFTGKIVKARTIAEVGDQINPNPGGDPPATYCKLIK